MNHAAAMNEVEVATISELLQRMLLKFGEPHSRLCCVTIRPVYGE